MKKSALIKFPDLPQEKKSGTRDRSINVPGKQDTKWECISPRFCDFFQIAGQTSLRDGVAGSERCADICVTLASESERRLPEKIS